MKDTQAIQERLKQLEEKFAAMGQDLTSYLDGLLHADYLTYWDYIHLDTLLSLQKPRTPFPDESIFILYHQITELYFKLILNAIERLYQPALVEDLGLFQRQLVRINTYFEQLIESFTVMVDGMDPREFLQFRMSLLPASGFQSGQYRMIEIWSTDFYLLAQAEARGKFGPDTSLEEVYKQLYWKFGATELATGRKTLTLRQFEKKYKGEFLRLAEAVRSKNLRQYYRRFEPLDTETLDLLRTYDRNANQRWPLAHLSAAARYLEKKPQVIEATGGTNWQQYLPPRRQQVVFFPELWEEEELATWGR